MRKRLILISVVAIAAVLIGTVGYVLRVEGPAPKDADLARQTLITYFNLLEDKQFAAAIAYHGSGYEILQVWNPDLELNNHVALLENGCEINGWQCLKIKTVLREQQISESEFKFVVQFENAKPLTEGESIYVERPCCGEEDNGERETDFEYTVRKVNDEFLVVTPPRYRPQAAIIRLFVMHIELR